MNLEQLADAFANVIPEDLRAYKRWQDGDEFMFEWVAGDFRAVVSVSCVEGVAYAYKLPGQLYRPGADVNAEVTRFPEDLAGVLRQHFVPLSA